MASYKLSLQAKEDLIRIHHYGTLTFGETQADKYFFSFFEYFEIIAKNPFTFEAVDYIKPGYRRCVCGVDSIFYRTASAEAEIMTILGKQDLTLIF